MPLTEEQRLRIEENKRKALEKRKNQLQNQTVPAAKTNNSFNDRVGGPSEKSKAIPAEGQAHDMFSQIFRIRIYEGSSLWCRGGVLDL